MGFFRQGYWSGLPISFFRGIFPTQGSNPHLMSPALAGGFFTTSATWEALHTYLMAPFQSGGATGGRTQGSHPSQAQSPHGPGLSQMLPITVPVTPRAISGGQLKATPQKQGQLYCPESCPDSGCVPSIHGARTGTGFLCTLVLSPHGGNSVLPKGRLPACTVSPQCLEGGYGGSLLTMDGGTHGCFYLALSPTFWGQKFTRHQALQLCPSGPQAPGQATSRPGEADSGACRRHLSVPNSDLCLRWFD